MSSRHLLALGATLVIAHSAASQTDKSTLRPLERNMLGSVAVKPGSDLDKRIKCAIELLVCAYTDLQERDRQTVDALIALDEGGGLLVNPTPPEIPGRDGEPATVMNAQYVPTHRGVGQDGELRFFNVPGDVGKHGSIVIYCSPRTITINDDHDVTQWRGAPLTPELEARFCRWLASTLLHEATHSRESGDEGPGDYPVTTAHDNEWDCKLAEQELRATCAQIRFANSRIQSATGCRWDGEARHQWQMSRIAAERYARQRCLAANARSQCGLNCSPDCNS